MKLGASKPCTPLTLTPMTFEQAVRGREAQAREADIVLLEVRFWSFEAREQSGQVLVARDLEDEARAIFHEILLARFPLQSVIPVAAFGWSDDASMEANNSSGFNPRPIAGGTRPSHHSAGRAIDLNPALNPYINGELVLPSGALYDASRPGTITPDSAPARAFQERGWTWGGGWTSRLDYHHFEKPWLPPRSTRTVRQPKGSRDSGVPIGLSIASSHLEFEEALMSHNKDEAGGETREHKEERKEANSEAKKEDTGSTGAGRHRGGHENSQAPGKTKDDD